MCILETEVCSLKAMAVMDLDAMDEHVSATDLAREWETSAELRRRASQHQLVSGHKQLGIHFEKKIFS